MYSNLYFQSILALSFIISICPAVEESTALVELKKSPSLMLAPVKDPEDQMLKSVVSSRKNQL